MAVGWKPAVASIGIQSGFFSSPSKKQPSTSQPHSTGLSVAFATVHSLECFPTFLLGQLLVLFLPRWPRLFFSFLCSSFSLSSQHCLELSPQLTLLESHLHSLIDLIQSKHLKEHLYTLMPPKFISSAPTSLITSDIYIQLCP